MSAVIDCARDWIGTPYRHQASCRGAGCDCLGLITGIWRDLGGALPDIPAYSRDWSEASGEEHLWRAARHLLIEKTPDDLDLGDVILFRMRDGAVAKHLGLVSCAGDAPKFIHAMSGHGVIESPLTHPWKRRIVARFQLPNLQQGD